MVPPIDKAQVERQFSRAANTYEKAAFIQREMSDQLLELTRPHITQSNLKIRDLGCGTGYSLTRLIEAYPNAQLEGIDISEAMLAKAQESAPDVQFIQADMESFKSDADIGLIFSNASVQWCELSCVLGSAFFSLKPGGLIAYSSFGPETHREIANAWSVADPDSPHRIDFLDMNQHVQQLAETGFQILESRKQLIRPEFSCAEELLESIKSTGATNASDQRGRGLLSIEKYRKFIDQLNAIKPTHLSYEALSFVAKKA